MARRKTRVGPKERLAGYGVLAVLGLIVVWLLVQQSRFNPAVLVATRPPQPQAAPQAASTQPLSATAALIPQVPGFSPLAPPESYSPDNLSDKINGRAELYLQAGFKEMSCRRFRLGEAGGASLEVFIYDMGAPAPAFAVFSGQRRPGAAGLALGTHAYATPNALFFTQGHYYVELVADRAADGLQKSLETFARAVLAKIPATSAAAAGGPELFPGEGLIADSVRLSATDAFGLEGFNQVYTGEYTLKSGKVTAFIAGRPSSEQAWADARKYVDFLTANGYKQAGYGAAGDLSVYSLDNSFEVVFVEGRTLAGVHDAPTLEAALELAAKLRAALKGKP